MGRGNLVGLLAAVLLTSASAQPAVAGLISDVGAIPNPFSPNGDGVYDEIVFQYTLAEQAWVVVTVEDSLGGVVRQFWSGEQDPGAYQYVWDGRDDWGALEADGAYVLVIGAAGIREVEVIVALDTVSPGIEDLFVAPSRFSPDGDGASDSLHVSFVVDSGDPTDAVTLRVLDASGESVRTLFSGSGVDSVEAYWNGRDDAGAEAPDTLYTVTIETSDVAHNSAEAELLVDLDRNAPALGVAYPDTSLSVVAVAGPDTVLTGWAYDRAGVRVVEVSTDGGAWETAETTPDPLVNGKVAWTHAVACNGCTTGPTDETLPVLVRSYDGVATADGLGHFNAQTGANPRLSFDVVFDVAAPEHVTSDVVGEDDVFTAGQTITIHTKWDENGYDVKAYFYQIDSEFDPGSVHVVDEGVGGLYTVTYTISYENTYAFSSPRRIRITASDYFHTVADSSVAVTVEEGGGGPYAITVDENFFDPMQGESVRIELGTYAGAVSVDVYNMAGTLVRTIEEEASGDDETVTSWDGKNDAGEVVASGVYLLRIRTDREEQIRKVAVVK